MKKISEKMLFEGNWLSLKESRYMCDDGKNVCWESVERRHNHVICVVVAKLVPSEKIVLIRQYRPAIENYIIAFPAGIAEGDDIRKEALKELKQETGYTGRIVNVSPILKGSTGVFNDSVRIITAEIDETASPNIHPKQALEPGEEIEVILKRKSEIKKFLLNEKNKGREVGIALWYMFCLESI